VDCRLLAAVLVGTKLVGLGRVPIPKVLIIQTPSVIDVEVTVVVVVMAVSSGVALLLLGAAVAGLASEVVAPDAAAAHIEEKGVCSVGSGNNTSGGGDLRLGVGHGGLGVCGSVRGSGVSGSRVGGGIGASGILVGVYVRGGSGVLVGGNVRAGNIRARKK
jgi:hypothetical protein